MGENRFVARGLFYKISCPSINQYIRPLEIKIKIMQLILAIIVLIMIRMAIIMLLVK